MTLLAHVAFEILAHPVETAYVVTSGAIMAIWKQSGWYWLTGWIALPFLMLVMLLLLMFFTPLYVLAIICLWRRYGWPETWMFLKNYRHQMKNRPTDPIVADCLRWRTQLEKWAKQL